MIYGGLILAFLGLIVNISAIRQLVKFEQIVNSTFSVFYNFKSVFMFSCRFFRFFNTFLTRGSVHNIVQSIPDIVNFLTPPVPAAFAQGHKKRKPRRAFFFMDMSVGYWLARTLSASAISVKMPACFLATIALMTSRVPIISATAMISIGYR